MHVAMFEPHSSDQRREGERQTIPHRHPLSHELTSPFTSPSPRNAHHRQLLASPFPKTPSKALLRPRHSFLHPRCSFHHLLRPLLQIQFRHCHRNRQRYLAPFHFPLHLPHTNPHPGSWQTRAGFSHDPAPRLLCPPLVSRYRDRKALKTYTVCGYDVFADPNSRAQAKTPFDANVVSNFDQMETLLDYCFIKLRIEGDGGLGHPLVLTEPVCNPVYNRRSTSLSSFFGFTRG